MSDRRVIVVEVTSSPQEYDERGAVEKEIDHVEAKIEGLQEDMERLDKRIGKLDRKTEKLNKSNKKFKRVIESKQDGASREAVESGLQTLKEGKDRCSKNEKTLAELEYKMQSLGMKIRDWQKYREALKSRQEEMRYDTWMRCEESLSWEEWKRSTYHQRR
jgi:chromosome segregation ATPase